MLSLRIARTILFLTCIADLVSSKQDLSSNDLIQSGSGDIQRPETTVLKELFSDKLLGSIYDLYYNLDQLSNNHTISELELSTTILGGHVAHMYWFLHRYDNDHELDLANGPLVNQESCISHLRGLNRRLISFKSAKLDSHDLNLYRILNTFGRLDNLLNINSGRSGNYPECIRLKIETIEGDVPTRYCVASLRRKSWTKDSLLGEMISVRIGLCLPKTCDSLDYQNKYQLIERLIEFNWNELDKNQTKLVSLYCLPDEDSSMRTWWQQSSPLIVLGFIIVWILLIIFATIKASSVNQSDNIDRDKMTEATGAKFYQAMSINENLRKLFSVRKAADFGQNNGIDLSMIDGIKVLSMLYILTAHIMMAVEHITQNIRDMTSLGPDSFLFISSNLAPASGVDNFFMITGLMTSYIAFKINRAGSIYKRPQEWLGLIAMRYLRLVPAFVMVVAFNKHLFRFLGSGPFWDYGTSYLSKDKMCQDESWLWTLLPAGNFKSITHTCNPVAWYLASDIQYLVVSPILLAILHRAPKIGSIVIVSLIMTSMMTFSYSLIHSGFKDLRLLFSVSPSAAPFACEILSKIYTWPIYRVSSYLLGILLGYHLYLYEKNKYSETINIETKLKHEKDDALSNSKFPKTRSKKITSIIIALKIGLPLSIGWPLIASYSRLEPATVGILVAGLWPLMHIGLALITSVYIALSVTGYGNRTVDRILTASFWKPFSRLSYSFLIVHINVVTMIVANMKHMLNLNFFLSISIYWSVAVAAYAAALVFYILVEAPINRLTNLAIPKLLGRADNADDKQSRCQKQIDTSELAKSKLNS